MKKTMKRKIEVRKIDRVLDGINYTIDVTEGTPIIQQLIENRTYLLKNCPSMMQVYKNSCSIDGEPFKKRLTCGNLCGIHTSTPNWETILKEEKRIGITVDQADAAYSLYCHAFYDSYVNLEKKTFNRDPIFKDFFASLYEVTNGFTIIPGCISSYQANVRNESSLFSVRMKAAGSAAGKYYRLWYTIIDFHENFEPFFKDYLDDLDVKRVKAESVEKSILVMNNENAPLVDEPHLINDTLEYQYKFIKPEVFNQSTLNLVVQKANPHTLMSKIALCALADKLLQKGFIGRDKIGKDNKGDYRFFVQSLIKHEKLEDSLTAGTLGRKLGLIDNEKLKIQIDEYEIIIDSVINPSNDS